MNIELSDIQKQVLTALVTAHRSADYPIKADTVASAVDRAPGSVRNVMGRLSDLGLVEGTRGPAGGYEPTDRAFEAIDRVPGEDGDTVTVAYGSERLDVAVERVELLGVHHPDQCRARIHLRRSVHRFHTGDPVAVGPTPVGGLLLAGEIVATHPSDGQLVVDVAQMETPSRATEPGEALGEPGGETPVEGD